MLSYPIHDHRSRDLLAEGVPGYGCECGGLKEKGMVAGTGLSRDVMEVNAPELVYLHERSSASAVYYCQSYLSNCGKGMYIKFANTIQVKILAVPGSTVGKVFYAL